MRKKYLAAILPLVIIFILFINAVVWAESDRGTDAQDARKIDPLSTVLVNSGLKVPWIPV